MRSLLVVDDSTFMRNFMKKILLGHGYTVVGEAENGRIAVEKYKECNPDVVTLDITMKEMSGLEALKEIIKYDQNAKVIMVSAMGQKPFVMEAIEAGAKGFLVKPFTAKKVVDTIEKLFV